ncbi:hypothetical protein C9374_004723 [Naegleria lovaniensis]|uniref:Uncharacterized protein n=1 Tax=Naegleria lovaniensis TaxID=51637 RepID=A0AA88GLT1_NAELO|nr:uncharacterized protein C9374_004723 [Naegleria lovaniensis]KAG2383386.1 hypothetical protein C9374_004723 [Naegleria lovaniensis]
MQHGSSPYPSESGLLNNGDEELRPLTATPLSSSLEEQLSSGQLNSGEQQQDENPPRLMLVICLLQGLIYPMIYNILILSWDYFMYRNNKVDYTTLVLMLSGLGIGHPIILIVYFAVGLVRRGKQADKRWAMAILTGFSLVVSCVLWLVVILLRTNDVYMVTLLFLALSICMSCWNSQIWLAVRVLPVNCMRAVVYGIECSGFLFGVLRLATKYVSLLISANEQANNNEFIFLIVFLTICCTIAFVVTIPFLWMLVKSEYYASKWNHYQQELEMAFEKQRAKEEQELKRFEQEFLRKQEQTYSTAATSNLYQTDLTNSGIQTELVSSQQVREEEILHQQHVSEQDPQDLEEKRKFFSRCVFILSIPSNVITCLVFPVLLVFLKSSLPFFKNNIFPIVLVTVFAFTAMMGSFTSCNCAFPRRWMSVLLSLSRLLLIPLFLLLCGGVIQFFNDHVEVVALIATMLFSFSHGYSSTSLYLKLLKECTQIEDFKQKSAVFSFNIFIIEACKLPLVIVSFFFLAIALP